MTRQDLYALVWERPVIHVSKRFGISDVALRKTCKKHDIPLPPLGYWAKLAHGKNVVQTPLPALKHGIFDRVYLVEKPIPDQPPEVTAAMASARERENSLDAKIHVPDSRPEKLHYTALAAERTLKKAKPDHEGFIQSSGPGLVTVRIGPPSIQRTVILLDTFLKALMVRGFAVADDEKGVAITVDGEVFWISISETRDRRAHEPTAQELKRQAERESFDARYPGIYQAKPTSKTYRSWDYFPSGRLAFELNAEWRESYQSSPIGYWRDRPTKKAEEYLNDAIVALVSAAASIRHKRAVAAEAERRRAEAAEQRRRDEAKTQRAKKRRDYLMEKAGDYTELVRLATFLSYLDSEGEGNNTGVDRLARELRAIVDGKRLTLGRDAINDDIVRLGLYGEDDV
jgi:hypothetical protein